MNASGDTPIRLAPPPVDLPADSLCTYDSIRGAQPHSPLVLPEQGATEYATTPLVRLAPSTDGQPLPPPPRVTLDRIVGRGGFGEVWEAKQPALKRTVAVKKLHLRPSAESEARELESLFRHEAFTTAALEHPNIVPVHDLVEDEAGRPMMAMKLVRGDSWHRRIREEFERLPPADFLARHLPILAGVAQAVAFAHDRGIVHRDLKPAQVMLGEYGEVLLMDWGLAMRVPPEDPRFLELGSGFEELAPDSQRASSPAGTPAYMAPEQTYERAEGVGPWTDVYLLGGTLYELLTGWPPHVAESGGHAFLRAQAGIVEPPARRTPGRAMPPELVALAMRSLDPFPRERPRNARAFLTALQAHLTGETRRRESMEAIARVERRAAPMPTAYAELTALLSLVSTARLAWPENPEAARWHDLLHEAQARAALRGGDLLLAGVSIDGITAGPARDALRAELSQAEAARARRERERGILRAATVALLGTVLVGGAWFISRLTDEKEVARTAQLRAEASRARAEDLLGFMIGDLRDSLQPLGKLSLLDSVAERSRTYFANLPPQDRTGDDAAHRYESIAQTAELLRLRGRRAEALALIAEAMPRARAGAEAQLCHLGWNSALAHLVNQRGLIHLDERRYPEAEEDFREFQAIVDELQSCDPGYPEWYLLEAEARDCLGSTLYNSGREEEALDEFAASLAIAERLAAAFADDPRYLRFAATAHGRVSNVNLSLKRSDAALTAAERQRDLALGLIGNDPADAEAKTILSAAIFQLARLYEDAGRIVEARDAFARDLALSEELLRYDPTNSVWRENLSATLHDFGALLLREGETSAALALNLRAEELWEDALSREPNNAAFMRSRLVNAHVTGRQLLELGLAEDALAQFRRHQEIAQQFLASDPENRDLLRDHAISHSLLHAALKRLGRRGEAIAALEEEVRLRAAHASSDPKDERAARELEKAQTSLDSFRTQ